jgi:hypothetical protein
MLWWYWSLVHATQATMAVRELPDSPSLSSLRRRGRWDGWAAQLAAVWWRAGLKGRRVGGARWQSSKRMLGAAAGRCTGAALEEGAAGQATVRIPWPGSFGTT